MPSASLWALHPEKTAVFKQHPVDNSKLFLLLMFLLSVINRLEPELYVIFTGERVSRQEYISLSEELFKERNLPLK